MACLRLFALLLLSAATCYPDNAYSAETTETLHWIRVLQSDAPKQEKDAACRQAKRVGDEKWVPALAALLTDEDLSHSARYALETIPDPEAGRALLLALDETTGSLKAGLINSLAERRETMAAGKIVSLLTAADPLVAATAATASAHFGTSDTIEALYITLNAQDAEPVLTATCDALLAIAYQLLTENRKEEASAIYQKLASGSTPDHVRASAYGGRIAAEEEHRALELMVKGIRGPNGPERLGALRMAHQLNAGNAVEEICRLVREIDDSEVRTALIAALEHRGDVVAVPTLIEMVGTDDESVRLAAIKAIGRLRGYAAAVPALTKAATSKHDAEQKAARQALLLLRGGNLLNALLQQMEYGSPDVQREVARVLVARAEPGTFDHLLPLLKLDDPKARKLVLNTLGRVATEANVPGLLKVIANAPDAKMQEDAGDALTQACARLTGNRTEPDAAPFLKAFGQTDLQISIEILPAAAMLHDNRIREQVRRYLTTSSLPLREAAVSAMLNAQDVEYVPDLLAIVEKSNDEHLRILALRAALRLAGDTDNFQQGKGDQRQIEMLREIVPFATQPEEKFKLLAGLAENGTREALELVLPLINDKSVSTEAAQAAANLVLLLPPAEGEFARTALQKAQSETTDSVLRNRATIALDHLGTSANHKP